MKQCEENPWASFAGKHPVGEVVEGTIRNITDFGLFIGLEGDIDGLVHHSDINWNETGETAIKSYKKGDTVKAKVLAVDVEKERISLGIKQMSENTSSNALDGMNKGDVVTCVVTAVQESGIEVKINDNVTSFIKKSDLSRDRQEQRTDRFAVGDRVDAKISSVDKNSHKVSVSIKALEAEEQKRAIEEYGSADSGASLGDILGAALSGESEGKKNKKSKKAE
jgi:small subunit ribosomal protein S1